MPEAYLRGNTVKYLRVPDEALERAKEESLRRDERRPFTSGRGGRGSGRGGGRGPPSGRGGRGSGRN